MAFEIFKPYRPRLDANVVSIIGDGSICISREMLDRVGIKQAVVLVIDKEETLIGVRAASPGESGYAIALTDANGDRMRLYAGAAIHGMGLSCSDIKGRYEAKIAENTIIIDLMRSREAIPLTAPAAPPPPPPPPPNRVVTEGKTSTSQRPPTSFGKAQRKAVES